jgi:hypothetical protein
VSCWNLLLAFERGLFLGKLRLADLLQLRFLIGKLPDRYVALLLHPVQMRLALACQLCLLLPSPGKLLELLLTFERGLLLGKLRLLVKSPSKLLNLFLIFGRQLILGSLIGVRLSKQRLLLRQFPDLHIAGQA